MYGNFASQIPRNPHNEQQMKYIELYAKEAFKEPAHSLSYSEFCDFEKTGSRVEYEREYTEHRKRLAAFWAMAAWYDDEKWLIAVEDSIWSICDEFTWSVPAHIKNQQKTDIFDIVTNLDLFSCETAFTLSELYYIFSDRLSPLIKKRIRHELFKRVINPFIEKRTKWAANNWSAACSAGIIASVIYMDAKEEFDKIIGDITDSMNTFLSSYNDDGCCLEGVLYHAYGFGHYCYAAQLIYEYTKGKINLFCKDKIKKMAEFMQKAYIEKNVCIPFSDAPHNYNYNIGFMHFLAENFENVEAPDIDYEVVFGDDIRYRFCDFIRNFFWYNDKLPEKGTNSRLDYFDKAQWYIYRGKNYCFAAKGGNNAEPHNHNDIGNFAIYSEGNYIIDDLGWCEYYNGYFGEKRYENICASSRGHSVPVINGEYQCTGKNHCAKVVCWNDKEFILDLTEAYDIANLRQLLRKFSLDENCIKLTDIVCGKVTGFSEKLITRVKPAIKDNIVYIGKTEISCDMCKNITISYENFNPRLSICKMDMKPVETAYLINFEIDSDKEEFEVNIVIKL